MDRRFGPWRLFRAKFSKFSISQFVQQGSPSLGRSSFFVFVQRQRDPRANLRRTACGTPLLTGSPFFVPSHLPSAGKTLRLRGCPPGPALRRPHSSKRGRLQPGLPHPLSRAPRNPGPPRHGDLFSSSQPHQSSRSETLPYRPGPQHRPHRGNKPRQSRGVRKIPTSVL